MSIKTKIQGLQEWWRRDRHPLVTKQNTRRVRSHSGATAPRGLALTNRASLRIG